MGYYTKGYLEKLPCTDLDAIDHKSFHRMCYLFTCQYTGSRIQQSCKIYLVTDLCVTYNIIRKSHILGTTKIVHKTSK